MSAGKEYTMLFQLSAQVGGGFGSTFGKAQQHVANLQKQIVDLNRTQGDISAYQKQQQAVESTKNKLSVLQQQYDNIKREIQETGTYSSDLENKLLSKQLQIDKTSASLERQKQKLDEMAASLRKAGVDTSDLEQESKRLAQELDALKKEQEQASDGAATFGETASAAFNAISEALIVAGIAEGLHEIWEAYMQCVSLSADFEETMSTVRALSGANADEIALLTARAKELGASTMYTAQESAQAMTYMAMAGWDANQMLSGMDGVLSLAAASGEDLASVSDIVTDNLTAFGLKASDTAHFADVLAAAATNSNTSVAIMGETFKNSAAVAGALEYSIEDVAVAVGLMANAGVKGSNAGTALRNIFTGLLSGVTLTSEAFGELEYSAVNADGTMKPFSQTIQELRGYFDQMTGAEKTMNAQTIAGQRAFAGLLSILNATDEDYNALAASIAACDGAAEKMAQIKMDNLRGDVTLLQSAWDALRVTVGEQFNPELRRTVQIGTSVTSWLNEFAGEHPAAVRGIMAFVAAMSAALAAIVGYMAVVKVAIPLIGLFKATIAGAIPGVGPILAITAGFAALTGVIVGVTSATKSEAAEVRGLTEASRQQYEQLKGLKVEYEQATALYGEDSESARQLAIQIAGLSESYESGKQSLSDYIAECEAFNSSLQDTVKSTRKAYDEIGKDEYITLGLVDRLSELAQQTDRTVASQEEMKAIIAALNSEMPELGLSFDGAIQGAEDYRIAIEAMVKSRYEASKYSAAQENLYAAQKKQIEAEYKIKDLTEQKSAAQKRANELLQQYNERLEEINAAEDTTGASYYDDKAVALWSEYEIACKAAAQYDEQLQTTQDSYNSAAKECSFYTGILEDYAEAQAEATDNTEAINSALSEPIAEAQALADAYTEAYNAALNSIQGQYALWDDVDEAVATSADSINASLESQASYWAAYNTNLESLASRTGDIDGLSDVIASFADGSKDSVNAIAGMADATDAELQTMVDNWKSVQEQQKAAADSLAELSTDFSNQMSAIQESVVESVSGMDASAEASAAAQATLNSFISSASSQLPRVQSTFNALGSAAASALGVSINIPHYAAGTLNAEPGIALVGEEGPEAVYLQGGERIMNARETREMLSLSNDKDIIQVVGMMPQLVAALEAAGAGNTRTAIETADSGSNVFSPVSVQVTIQVEGDASKDTVDALNAYGDDFAERVLEVMEQAGIDEARRRY